MFILENQPKYLPQRDAYEPTNFETVVTARSSDTEAKARRIDDIVALLPTHDPEYPVETRICFSNPAFGLDPRQIQSIFESDLPIEKKHHLVSAQITLVKPPTHFSLDPGLVRTGLVVAQKLNIDTGKHKPPRVFLGPVVNKQRMTHRQLNTFIRSDLTDRDTRNHQELLRTAEFLEANRLHPYSQVSYDRDREATVVDGTVWSWLSEVTSPAHTIIQELTVNASAALAAFSYWNDIPVIYKGTDDYRYGYESVYSTQPIPHRHYNLTAYLNISRQLRSFVDKVNGLQISCYLQNYQQKDVPIKNVQMEELAEYMFGEKFVM